MKIGRAEIGIILLANNLPYVGWLYYFLSIFFPFVNLMIGYSLSCAITGIGLILFMSDRKGFLRRMKGNKFVAALLVICGSILIGFGLFFVYASFAAMSLGNAPHALHPPTFEEWTTFLLFCAWIGQMLISGILWIFYGLGIWRYEKTDFPPLKQEIDSESRIGYPRDLFAKYAKQYHNPSGVLGFHISLKMRKRQNKRTSR